LAASAQNVAGVAGYINFSGGHGSSKGHPGTYCPKSIIRAARTFGAKSKKPSLWIYVENDSYLGPRVAKSMFKAFRNAGGNATLQVLPRFENEGHYLFRGDTISIWGPVIDNWLANNKLLRQGKSSD
jgi:pimeloyl-ACP methyl ester carboxylesterase